MGRRRKFKIKETLTELGSFKSKVKDYRNSKRLDALIAIKAKEGSKLSEIAEDLDIHLRTLNRWVERYKKQGIENYLSKETREKPSKIITPEIHQAIEKRLKDPENPFSGYVEVQEWLQREYGVEIGYQWLWKYLRTKFNTRLKVPRKVNVKKEEGAERSFFKNAGGLVSY